MVVLTEKQIEYGFDYFHKDEPQNKWVIEVSEYNGEKALTINCTQLGDSFTPEYKTAKEKNRVVQEWCDFLQKNTTAFTELTFGTRMPQKLFDAVCAQKNLKKLHIKWGVYPDISRIANLKNLESLSIEGDCFAPKNIHVNSFDFLNDMKQLRYFNFLAGILKSKDYTPVLSLENIEHLTLRPTKELKNLYNEIIKLPKLKYGLLVNKPELYKK